MSKIISVKNPNGRIITFSEDQHKYTDNKGNEYRSVTKIIHSLFPEFERDKMAYFTARKRVMTAKGYASKDDCPVCEVMAEKEVVIQEWEDNRNQACDMGTQVHRYAECKMLGIDFDMEFTVDKAVKLAKTLDSFLIDLEKDYELVETEKIVFCPTILLAGMVDLIMKNKKTNKLCVFDWKTNKQIAMTDGNGKKGKLFLEHIEHANYWHYAIQLNVYRWIMNKERYGDFVDTELGLFHINTRKVRPYQLPLLDWESQEIANYCQRSKGKK